MNPSDLEECRDMIKDIDSNLIELLSNNEKLFSNEINDNIHNVNILQNNNIISNIFNNLNILFKVNFESEIQFVIFYIFKHFSINEIIVKNINKIIELVSKRIYIGHYVADFKLNKKLSKYAGLNKEDIMKSITIKEVEEKVLQRILKKCKDLNINESFISFILDFYKSYLILYNKKIQVEYIYSIS